MIIDEKIGFFERFVSEISERISERFCEYLRVHLREILKSFKGIKRVSERECFEGLYLIQLLVKPCRSCAAVDVAQFG